MIHTLLMPALPIATQFSDHDTLRIKDPSSRRTFHVISLLITGLLLFFSFTSMAQTAAQYTFLQTTTTYSSISGGGTTLSTNGWNDEINTASLGFTFTFLGVNYTTVSVNSNGYVTFGATVSAATGYTPISATTAYSGAVSAMGINLGASNGGPNRIKVQTIGTAPNRVFVVEWANSYRYNGAAAQSDDLDFQIRLSETSNAIDVVYGTCSAQSTNLPVQVGLRGATNADFNNRSTTSDWAATTAGGTNTATCTTTNTILPAANLNFRWSPPVIAPGCAASPTAPANGSTLCQGVQTLSWPAVATATSYDVYLNSGATATTLVSASQTGTTYATSSLGAGGYAWRIVPKNAGGSATGCANWTFTLNANPTVAAAGPAQSICQGTTATLAANSPSIGTGAWSVVSGPSTLSTQFSSTAANNAVFTPAGGVGAYNLRWTIANSPCPNSTSDVTITFLAAPTVPVMTPSTITICAGTPTALSAASTSSLTQLSSPFNSTGGPATLSVTGANNASIYPWTINVSGLPTSGVTVETVTINGVTHTFPDDLDILLQSPTTTNVILMSDAGGGVDLVNNTFTFKDGSPALADATTNASGTYAPTNFTGTGDETWSAPGPGAFTQASPSLSLFTGDVNGDWHLMIRDDENGDDGSVTSWSITFRVPATLTYTWSPNVALSSTTGSSVDAAPTSAQVYTVTVSSGQNSCTSSNTVPVSVNQPPSVTCPSNITACSNDAAFALTGASPGGGTYSGHGVSAGNFDPAVAGPGTQIINYAYTDGNGCTSTCTFNVTVTAASTWYDDTDADGAGDPNVTTQACTQPSGYVGNSNDQCPGDPAKQVPGVCGCGVADVPTTWYADGDGDGYGDPGMSQAGFTCNQPAGYVADNTDDCPTLFGRVGDTCNDGDANTTNDMITASCVCEGTSICSDNYVEMVLTTDGNGSETSWDISPFGGGAALCSGSGYGNNTSYSQYCCLPDGSYVLSVYDSFGDGMCCSNGTGGYILRLATGERIIDNANDGTFGSLSQLKNGTPFSLPLGTDKVVPWRCDKEDWLYSDFIQAVVNPAVSAEYGVGAQNDDGYQFWFFDPDGTYSRRVLYTHANASYLFPYGATRCSYLRFANVISVPIPQDVLLNVRVRSMVNGTYAAFGPACRVMISTATQCPTTQLVDDVGDPNHSCGLTGVVLNGSTILHAEVVSAANKYKWEFTRSGQTRRTTSNGSSLPLNQWYTNPLVDGVTYNVRVQVSFDNGSTYCAWGAACTIATVAPAAAPSAVRITPIVDEVVINMWPNPTRDGLVNLKMLGLPADLDVVTVEFHDLLGQRILSKVIPANGGNISEVILLDRSMPSGLYLVNVMANEQVWVQRLVVQ